MGKKLIWIYMSENELDHSEILWQAAPNLRMAMKSAALFGLCYVWIWGPVYGVIFFFGYRLFTVYEFIVLWFKISCLFSILFPVMGMLLSLRYYRYEYFITNRGLNIRRGSKIFYYPWKRIRSIKMKKIFLLSRFGSHLDIQLYPNTLGEKPFMKEYYPDLRGGHIPIDYVPDYAIPKKIIEQYIDENSNEDRGE